MLKAKAIEEFQMFKSEKLVGAIVYYEGQFRRVGRVGERRKGNGRSGKGSSEKER